jgi:hypothetical protein
MHPLIAFNSLTTLFLPRAVVPLLYMRHTSMPCHATACSFVLSGCCIRPEVIEMVLGRS